MEESEKNDKKLDQELYIAVNQQKFDIARALLDAGAGVNYIDPSGFPNNGLTPLHWVAFYGEADLAKQLIEKGANLEATDIMGRTPLVCAALTGHVNTVFYLLKMGANVSVMNYSGWVDLPDSHRNPGVVRLIRQGGFTDRYTQLVPFDKKFRDLSKELVQSISSGKTSLFCGAGISFNSGLPIVTQIKNEIIKKLGLKEEDKDILINSNLPFEAFMSIVATHCPEFDLLLNIFSNGEPNTNHYIIAKLAKKGLIKIICTTNFDVLIEKAFEQEGLMRNENFKVYFNDDEFRLIDWDDNDIVKLIKIHGSMEDPTSLAISLNQVSSTYLSDKRKEVVENIFAASNEESVLVLGYSCSDLFDITPQIQSIRVGYKKIFFIEHNSADDEKSENITVSNAKNPFKNFFESFRMISNTDNIIKHIWVSCLNEEYPSLTEETSDWQKQIDVWASRTIETTHEYKYDLIASLMYEISEFKKAKITYQKSLEIIRNRNDKMKELTCLQRLGSIHISLGEYEDAKRWFKLTIKIAQDTKDKNAESRGVAGLGSVSKSLGDFHEAKTYYEQSLEMFEDPLDRSKHLHDLGIVCRQLGLYEKAIEYFERSISINQLVGDKKGEGRSLGDLGNLFIELYRTQNQSKYLSEAKNHFEASLQIAKAVGDRHGEGVRLANLSSLLHEEGKIEDAHNTLNEAIEIARQIGDRSGEGSRTGNLGYLFFREEHYEDALQYFSNALKIAQELSDRDREARWIQNMGMAYLNLRDFKQARIYVTQALVILQDIKGLDHPHTITIKNLIGQIEMVELNSLTGY
jgi:tetratricopeptide (TPR) repeat protein